MAEFRAGWWWIDRWRKSTAYTDMTLAEQGAYRNLLDELWLRGGELPLDQRILAKIAGDALAWPTVGPAVMSRFYSTDTGWRNTTHDEVSAKSTELRDFHSVGGKARAKGAQRVGGRFTSTLDQHAGKAAGKKHQQADQPPSPSPDQTPDQSPTPVVSVPTEPHPAKAGASRTQLTAEVDTVVAHYVGYHPKAKAGPKERARIRDRLREGWGTLDLIEAIDGNHRSPWHTGQNPDGKRWHSIGLIFRDADHVQQFLDVPKNGQMVPSERLRKTANTLKNWLDIKDSKENDHDPR